jgi:hypothetical protein
MQFMKERTTFLHNFTLYLPVLPAGTLTFTNMQVARLNFLLEDKYRLNLTKN